MESFHQGSRGQKKNKVHISLMQLNHLPNKGGKKGFMKIDQKCFKQPASKKIIIIIKGSLVANFRYTNFWVAGQE